MKEKNKLYISEAIWGIFDWYQTKTAGNTLYVKAGQERIGGKLQRDCPDDGVEVWDNEDLVVEVPEDCLYVDGGIFCGVVDRETGSIAFYSGKGYEHTAEMF